MSGLVLVDPDLKTQTNKTLLTSMNVEKACETQLVNFKKVLKPNTSASVKKPE